VSSTGPPGLANKGKKQVGERKSNGCGAGISLMATKGGGEGKQRAGPSQKNGKKRPHRKREPKKKGGSIGPLVLLRLKRHKKKNQKAKR